MRSSSNLPLAIAAAALLVGCAGPEQKLGRGFTNLTEFTRLGEMNRSVEQAALFDDNTIAPTTGVIRGFNQSIKRTFVGLYEVVTFPIPNYRNKDYGPVLKPQYPDFPASYKPGTFADSILSTDSALGFGSGDIAPMIPGSRFRIFEP
ncbi:MAG TPA: exosortase system-associated protein, TIGR04073 family [Verrucomicrobiae bacterium]|jgi:putative exosortase-associated protein (TIGR04073 family)